MKKASLVLMFILSAASLTISLLLFYQIGVTSDKLSISPQVIYGNQCNLFLSWIRLILLLITVIFFGAQLIIKFSH